MQPLDLVPAHGLKPARFGMTPAEVREVLSEPEVYEDWMGGNLNDSLLFRGLIFGFDRCDSRGPLEDARMTELRIHVPSRGDVLLWGRPLSEWSFESLRAQGDVQGIRLTSPRPDCLENGSLGLDLSFGADGRLSEVGAWAPRQDRTKGWFSRLRTWSLPIQGQAQAQPGSHGGRSARSFLDGMIGSASKIDAASIAEEISRVLTAGEQIEQAYQVIRDYFVFTDKRLLLVNKRGITGKKVEYQSIPYKSITHFSVSTVGRFDFDSELKIWIRGAAVPIQKRFSATLSIHEVQRVLAGYVLG